MTLDFPSLAAEARLIGSERRDQIEQMAKNPRITPEEVEKRRGRQPALRDICALLDVVKADPDIQAAITRRLAEKERSNAA